MPNFSLISDKLLIYDPNKSRSTCHIYISHQSPVEEKNLGKLFILAEIGSKDKINIDIINTILDELKLSYYNTEDLHIETAFEKALERVNQRIADMVGDYDTNWLDKLNMITVVVKEDQLHFSYLGRLYAFLIRNNRIVNIIESTDQTGSLTEKINPLKAFSNIISGNLQTDDTLIFCTSSLLDYISQEKLKRTATENQPQRTVNILENLLAENNLDTAFGALILKTISQEVGETASAVAAPVPTPSRTSLPLTTDTSQSSMEDLLQKKESANRVLAPSLGRYVWESTQRIFLKITDFIKLTIFRQSPRRLRLEKEIRHYRPAQQPDQKKAASSSILISIIKGVKWIFISLASLAVLIINLFRKKDKVVEKITAAPTTFSNKTSRFIIKIKRLPRLSKFLLLSVVIIAFILAQSIFSTALSEQRQEKSVEYDKTISLISQKILNAEAALLYDNEDGAKELLNEAASLLQELPQKNQEQKQKIEELQNDINSQLEKTKHIANMATITIADFSTGETTANLSGVVLIGGTLYTFDATTKTIYGVDIDTGDVTSWPQEDFANSFQYAAPQGNNVLFFDTANGMNEFNTKSEEFSGLQFSMASDDVNIANLATYENRIYFLDIKNSQILRASRITGGFSQPAGWIKDGTSLQDSKSLAVDGNVFVLKKDGQLIRFFQGNRQDWSLSSIDPALSRADKVWTDAATDNIYILDKQGKRIIEFTKEGKLINQYISASFTDLKDFTVDFANKTMYILNGNSLVSIDILS